MREKKRDDGKKIMGGKQKGGRYEIRKNIKRQEREGARAKA